LNGTYIPPAASPEFVKMLLPQLQRAPGVENQAQRPFYTQEQYCEGWKKQKERTSAGPSGLHFGHFKAAALHEVLADFDYKMMSLPYRIGFSPARW
jgi:hypothetical protein